MSDADGPARPPDAPASAGDRPRILLVAYHFAPSKAVGALRWTKMSAMLAEAGYAFDVLTAAPQSEAVPTTPLRAPTITVHHIAPRKDALAEQVGRLLAWRDRMRRPSGSPTILATRYRRRPAVS